MATKGRPRKSEDKRVIVNVGFRATRAEHERMKARASIEKG